MTFVYYFRVILHLTVGVNMLKVLPLILVSLLINGCSKLIRNDFAQITTEVESFSVVGNFEYTGSQSNIPISPNDLIGYWVGTFNAKEEFANTQIIDNGQTPWHSESKIVFAIESIKNNKVKGFTVIAGSTHKFSGTLSDDVDQFVIFATQQGKDKNVGNFNLNILKNDSKMHGTWTANKQVEIKERICVFDKRSFSYNSSVTFKQSTKDLTDSLLSSFVEMPEDYSELYSTISSPSEIIYTLNPSVNKLTEDDISGASVESLVLLRNTIFARHGYAFKKRPMRIFFEEQDWYVPISSNPKQGLTTLEKKNLKIIDRYEKNYRMYESFAR